MLRGHVLALALGVIALGSAQLETQDSEIAALEKTGGCGPGRHCPRCDKGMPKGFDFAPCPVKARFSGHLNLSGDVSHGKMSLAISGKLRNSCPTGTEPCRRANLDIERFIIEHLYYEKNNAVVDVPYPTTAGTCTDCNIIITYPETPKPPPTPPAQCKTRLDFIDVIDVSKSMKTFKGTPEKTRDLLQEVAKRFKIDNKSTRWAQTAFGDDARIDWRLCSKIATDQHKVHKNLGTTKFTNQFSNHGAALDSALDQFKRNTGKHVPKVLALFADGKPNKDIRRLKHAVKRLRCQPNTCFAIVGINTLEHSEEDAFFRELLACHPTDPCPELFLVKPTKSGQNESVAKALSEYLCHCATNGPRVAEPEAVTTFTVRIAGMTLPDFGTRDELNRSVDEMLWNAAEATGVTPDRLTAIAIEDTAGNTVDDDLIGGANRTPGQGNNAEPATLVEVMFEEPGLNAELGSEEATRQLATIMSQQESTFKDRCMERGLAGVAIDRIAYRQNDGNMPIIDVVQQ